MAYVDKITTLRRMALITTNSGHIIWEGVDIEGMCLLKKYNYLGHTTMLITVEDLEDLVISKELLIKYQDLPTDDYWEPRATKESK